MPKGKAITHHLSINVVTRGSKTYYQAICEPCGEAGFERPLEESAWADYEYHSAYRTWPAR